MKHQQNQQIFNSKAMTKNTPKKQRPKTASASKPALQYSTLNPNNKAPQILTDSRQSAKVHCIEITDKQRMYLYGI